MHYGNLKEGAAVTAFAVYALSHVDTTQCDVDVEALQAACDALIAQISRHGCVANPGGKDYPTYASAMLLIAAERLHLQLAEDARNRLVDYLLTSQIDATEGYTIDEPDFGGWDMEGDSGGLRKSTGTNISVGTLVAEALTRAANERTKSALADYQNWLKRCQNLSGDGGFYFHTQLGHDGNKAGWIVDHGQTDRKKPRSYGSATADGLRSLAACNVDPNSDESRVRSAGYRCTRPSIACPASTMNRRAPGPRDCSITIGIRYRSRSINSRHNCGPYWAKGFAPS